MESTKRPAARLLVLLSTFLALAGVSAQGPSAGGAVRAHTLDNGLEVFIIENDATPLVRVQLVFRAGAISQTAADAGAFALHASMMAQGNERYRSAAALSSARAVFGAAEVEHAASAEMVSFRSLQPASRLAEALEYWASVFEAPLFDESALEAVKKSAIRAAQGPFAAEPASRLFASQPWRKDPLGSPSAISAITRDALLKLHRAWFVPNNAALFIWGGVKEAKAWEAAKAAFGDWQKGSDPWGKPPAAFPLPAVKRPTFVLAQDAALPDGEATVRLSYRGPDLAGDPKARTTAPAMAAAGIVWEELLNDPAGAWTARLSSSVKGFRSQRVAFEPLRDGSLISMDLRISLQKGEPAWRTAMIGVKEQVRGFELEQLRKGAAAYLGPSSLANAKARLAEARTVAANAPSAWLSALGAAWSSGGRQWMLELPERIEAVAWKDIEAFTDAWIAKNLEVVVLSLSPSDFASQSAAAKANGFEIEEAGKRWWEGR